MKIKTLALILSLAIITCTLPISSLTVSATTSGTTGDCTWTLDGTILTISGSGSMHNQPYMSEWYNYTVTEVIIEEGVTSIGDRAFYQCNKITSVVIPDSIIQIGDYAFGSCKSIKSIIIPKNVISISSTAFSNCNQLECIAVSDNNATFTSENGILFSKDKTTLIRYPAGKADASYTIPNTVLTIGKYSFENCMATDIVIPSSVISIEDYAFYYCENIENITIPDSVANIGMYAFEWCGNLESIKLSENITIIESGTFLHCSKLENITIPANIITISDYAFSGCSLKAIIIPDSVESIEQYAFSYCNYLKTIEIGSGLKYLEVLAFKGSCDCLTSITVNENNNYFCSENGILFNKDKTELIRYPSRKSGTAYSIPDSVSTIQYYAFDTCQNLKSIEIPNTVTAICQGAFEYCSSLESIDIPNSVINLGKGTFDSCLKLKNVIIGDGVTVIDTNTFYNCPKLSNISFGDNIENIGEYAFKECTSLTAITIPDSVTSIGKYAFEECAIKKITIPNGVTDISYVFKNCNALESIVIPSSVAKASFAFSGCTSLKNVYFCGTKEQWDSIPISYADTILLNIEPFFHKYSSVTIPNTCTKQGYTSHTCEYCGNSYTDAYINAIGHDYENGSCTICGSFIESDHNYSENTDQTWIIYRKNAKSITVTFSAETITEDGYDYIYLYNSADEEVGKYTGSELSSQNITIAGNTIKIRLYSDRINTAYGFKITNITTEFYAIGDTDCDGNINATDLTVLRISLLSNDDCQTNELYDINSDGEINIRDLVRLKKYLADNKVVLGS